MGNQGLGEGWNSKSSTLYIASNLYANRFKAKNSNSGLSKLIIEDQTNESPEFQLEVKEFDDKLQRILAGMNENNRLVFFNEPDWSIDIQRNS